MVTLIALYFFIGLALAAGIAAYNRLDQKAVYQIEKLKIAYGKSDLKKKLSNIHFPSRRVQASAV